MKKLITTAFIVLTVSACQSIPEAELPANKFVFNANKTVTKEAIIATFMPEGYQITKDSEFQLVLDKKITNSFGASFAYGSSYNVNPSARLTLTITGDNPTTVHSQIAMVTNPGSGFEKVHEINNSQEDRAAIALRMEKAKAALPKK